MSQSRQLAAIMFTDIVGYTALMGEDEQKAFDILRRNRQIQHPIIERFNGRWIKEIGDGVLSSFSTVTDAVLCANSIQQSCNGIADLKLRIGIHLGEVVFENNDVFGDGVNIASRLQSLAPAGGIWVSDSVQKNIANKTGVETKFIREEYLKNVKEPIQIYEVNVGSYIQGQTASFTTHTQTKLIPEKSIAVLPFVNMSNDPEQEYFSDGMAEEIINSLTHLKDLKIAGRTSSFQFKGKNLDLREVGEKLGVRTVLEGSVRKQGSRLRITAQLINVEDGFHFWSQKYDREMDDIFAVQDEIALAITEQLRITLFDNDLGKITKSFTQNPEAYELYLKGRFHLNRRGAFILTALEFFKQAIAIDPKYPLAYTGFADAIMYSVGYGFSPGHKVMKLAKQAALTAIQLDNTLGEAYCALATHYVMAWNWSEAKKNYCKAIELNPKYAPAYSLYGMLYLAFAEGKFNEAEKQGQIAIRLEPLSAIDHGDLAWTLLLAGRFEESLAYANTGIELDSNSFLSQRIKALSFLALQRYEDAIDTFLPLVKMSNRHQQAVNGLIWAYCGNKNFGEANALMDELKVRSENEYISMTQFGLSAAWLGDIDMAFECLEKACQDYDFVYDIKYAPYVPASIKNDSRFISILETIGFPG